MSYELRLPKDLPLVIVWWDDIVTDAEWNSGKPERDQSQMGCVSIGFMLSRTEATLHLAACHGQNDDKWINSQDIPMGAVRHVLWLDEKDIPGLDSVGGGSHAST